MNTSKQKPHKININNRYLVNAKHINLQLAQIIEKIKMPSIKMNRSKILVNDAIPSILTSP